MIFKNIQELIDLVPNCQFCNSPLVTTLAAENKVITHYKYSSGFVNTTYPKDALDLDYFKNRTRLSVGQEISFLSEETDETLNFCYKLNEKIYPIFLINKLNNKISGNGLERVQKILWDHKLSIIRHCTSEKCKNPHQGYIGKTEPIRIERKRGNLYPFIFNMEVISVNMGEKTFALISMYETRKTTLLSLKKSDMISQLPFMNLHKMKSAEQILNKVKTIIIFS